MGRGGLTPLPNLFNKEEVKESGMSKGRTNVVVIPPGMNYRGWNVLAFRAGYTVARLREMQEEFRKIKEYEKADLLRDLATELDRALRYTGVRYTEKEDP